MVLKFIKIAQVNPNRKDQREMFNGWACSALQCETRRDERSDGIFAFVRSIINETASKRVQPKKKKNTKSWAYLHIATLLLLLLNNPRKRKTGTSTYFITLKCTRHWGVIERWNCDSCHHSPNGTTRSNLAEHAEALWATMALVTHLTWS